MNKLYLIDVSSLFFRAFFAVRPLTSPSGIPTNAIYGFLSMLLKLLKEEKPQYLVFCYDRKEPSFRKALYSDYKAHRTEMPEDLAPQIPYIKKLADIMGIPSFEVPDYEADDIIGSLTKIGRENNFEVYIVSGDKDFAQLLQPKVFMYDTMKGEKIDSVAAEQKWGVKPEQFIDYLALVGDSSDNIPGVAGIGPKGAQKLLAEFQTLDGIYQNIDQIKGALQEKLKNNRDNAYLSRQLSTIALDCLQVKEISELARKPFSRDQLSQLLLELNFKTLEKNIWDLDVGETSRPPQANEKTSAPIKKESSPSPKVPSLGLVTQTKSLSLLELLQEVPDSASIWFGKSSQGYYAFSQGCLFQIQGELKDLKEQECNWRWNGHNLKEFWHLFGVNDPQPEWDSSLASYVLKAGENTDFSRLVEKYLQSSIPDLLTSKEHLQYSVLLKNELMKLLEEQSGLDVYFKLDLPLAPILYAMERVGIRLDPQVLKMQSESLAKDLQNLETTIHHLAGEPFNIGSPKQLSRILFEKLQLPTSKKTKTGFSTDTDVLESLLKVHPIAEHLIQYREFSKLKSTYVDALPLLVREDGRIHTTFNQALTTTGRLSSVDPNLQNIPIRTERGAKIRAAFVASEGCQLIAVDYSQIELRVLAHICEDPNLINAFINDQDIHAATASEVFGVSLAEVTSEQRRIAKAVNFGIAYGQGAFGLAETLRIPRSEASDIIKRYFTRFSRVQNYIEETIKVAKEKGYVETLFGRRRYIDELQSKNVAIQKFGERAAINAPIQGTAADLVKKAMLDLRGQTSAQLLLQVHDELIFEVNTAAAASECQKIKTIMENVLKLKVPLKANFEIGPNWDF
jgi:DNA polymerase-1